MPPKWAVEAFIDQIGRAPAAVGRFLDRLAAGAWGPVVAFIVKFFSSIILGLIWLGLVGAYVAVGSGLASVRAYFEMTDMEFFNAWPMVTLMTLTSITLTVVTLRRIRLSVFKLGVWTVHIGILTLVAGSVWYFYNKLEGSVRVHLNETVGDYYDATERALFVYRIGPDGKALQAEHSMVPMPGLPIYYEHLPERGNAIDHAIQVPLLKEVTVRAVGYYPAAQLQPSWAPAPGTGNPAVRVSMTVAGEGGGQWLIGGSPKDRVLDAEGAPFGIEFLVEPDDAKIKALTTPIPARVAITVRVPKLGIEQLVLAGDGKPVAITGTPYTVTLKDQMSLPLVSKGYEGAFSNALSVAVSRKEPDGKTFDFTRMALFRYPELSPDFITENGKQKRVQARVDNDIEILFHDAQRDQFWITQRNQKLEFIHRAPSGNVDRRPVEVGKAIETMVGPVPLRLSILERTENAALQQQPMIIPERARARTVTVGDVIQTSLLRLSILERTENAALQQQPSIIPERARARTVTVGDVIQTSLLRLEIAGKSADGKPWQIRDVHVPFVQYASMEPPPKGRQPTIVDVPGVGRIGFLMSTTRRPLPTWITLTDFKATKYKGAMQSYADYASYLHVRDRQTGAEEKLVAQLNSPASTHGMYYFQAAWDGKDDASPAERFSVLGIANRPGVYIMTAGSILIIIGIAYAFYVKPILLRMKKEQVAAWAAAKQAGKILPS